MTLTSAELTRVGQEVSALAGDAGAVAAATTTLNALDAAADDAEQFVITSWRTRGWRISRLYSGGVAIEDGHDYSQTGDLQDGRAGTP